MDLALVNLAKSRHRVAQTELAQPKREFPRAVKLLEVQAFGGPLGFQVVIRLGGIHVGVCRRHVERRFLQGVGNQFQLAHDAGVNLLDVENHHPVLVGAANNNPVQGVGQGLVGRRNQLFEQKVVNLVVLFGLQHGILAVELQIARLHGHTALAGGAVGTGQRACHHLLGVAGQAVHVPEFPDGQVLYAEFVPVVQHGQGFAVGGIGFAGVVWNLVSNGLFKEHGANLEINRTIFIDEALFVL